MVKSCLIPMLNHVKSLLYIINHYYRLLYYYMMVKPSIPRQFASVPSPPGSRLLPAAGSPRWSHPRGRPRPPPRRGRRTPATSGHAAVKPKGAGHAVTEAVDIYGIYYKHISIWNIISMDINIRISTLARDPKRLWASWENLHASINAEHPRDLNARTSWGEFEKDLCKIFSQGPVQDHGEDIPVYYGPLRLCAMKSCKIVIAGLSRELPKDLFTRI